MVAQVRDHMHVGDLADREPTQHTLVLEHLVALEPVDGVLTMQDGDKVDELSVVIDLRGLNIDRCLDA